MMPLLKILFWGILALLVVVPANGEATICSSARSWISRAKTDLRTVEPYLQDYARVHQQFPQAAATEQLPKSFLPESENNLRDRFKTLKISEARKNYFTILVIGIIVYAAIFILFCYLTRNIKDFETTRSRVTEFYFCAGFSSLILFVMYWSMQQCPLSIKPIPQNPTSNYEFGYAVNNNLALLHSPGIDCVQDCGSLAKLVEGAADSKELELRVQPFIYDPTNGSMSAGDLFRIVEMELEK